MLEGLENDHAGVSFPFLGNLDKLRLMAISNDDIRECVLAIVLRYAPGEELSFDGVWDDTATMNVTGDQELTSLPDTGGSRMMIGGIELPLLSAVIIPVALWAARKLGELAVDDLLSKIRKWLTERRTTNSGTLTEAQIDEIARTLYEKLEQKKGRRRKKSADKTS